MRDYNKPVSDEQEEVLKRLFDVMGTRMLWPLARQRLAEFVDLLRERSAEACNEYCMCEVGRMCTACRCAAAIMELNAPK